MKDRVALTQTVQKGGCAAKVAASELRKILHQVQFPPAHPELLVDGGLFDDAAVYKINDELALVQTLDFFTPIVDTAKRFGEIAAANALSDVYAMGGRPKTALGILAFPIATMESDVIVDVMQGASDKIREAGANFVGGHSIDDDTLKFGLSVTGFVNPSLIWSNAGAKTGDILILTKPLGTGTATAALKRQQVSETDIEDVLHSMAALNNAVDFLSLEMQRSVHAATDITGFGLSGHAMQLALASKVTLQIETENVPRFARALDFLKDGFLTKAHRSNALYTEVSTASSAVQGMLALLIHDPQTSGGLLLSVAPEKSSEVLQALQRGFPASRVIGKVLDLQEKAVKFV